MLAFRGIARAFAFKFGLPLSHMFQVSVADGLSTRLLLNLFQAEVLQFITSCEVWAIITVVAQRFHLTEEEWKELHLEEMQREQQVEAEQQAETAATDQQS
jgi:hypothetical protein